MLNPRRVSINLAKTPKSERIDAIGGAHGCDHRAAWSKPKALALLADRNLLDEITGHDGETYPRMAMYHADDGRKWAIYIESLNSPPTIQECVDGLPSGPERVIEPKTPPRA